MKNIQFLIFRFPYQCSKNINIRRYVSCVVEVDFDINIVAVWVDNELVSEHTLRTDPVLKEHSKPILDLLALTTFNRFDIRETATVKGMLKDMLTLKYVCVDLHSIVRSHEIEIGLISRKIIKMDFYDLFRKIVGGSYLGLTTLDLPSIEGNNPYTHNGEEYEVVHSDKIDADIWDLAEADYYEQIAGLSSQIRDHIDEDDAIDAISEGYGTDDITEYDECEQIENTDYYYVTRID